MIHTRSAMHPESGRGREGKRRPHFGTVSAAVILNFYFAGSLWWPAVSLAQQTSGKPPATVSSQVSKAAEESILQGFSLLAEHNAAGAEAAFRQAVEAQPEAEPAHRGLGLALREEGRFADSLRELQVATRLDPSDADAHFSLGNVAWTLSLPPNSPRGRSGGLSSSDYQNLAGAEFSRALALSPNDATLRMSLATLYMEADRAHEAIEQATEAVRLAPNNSAAHVTLGRAYFGGGEEEKAATEFQAATKLDPQDGGAFLALGQLRQFQRRYVPAEEAVRHAIQVSPNLGPAYAELAQILDAEGKTNEERALLDKAVTLDMQDWRSQYQLAVLLNQAGESARATELLEKVLRANPDFAGAREQLAAGRLRRGDSAGATDLAEKMIGKDPQGPEGHRIMALALWKQRDYEGSLAECAMALNGDPNSGAMLALQSIALWQLSRKKESQAAIKEAAKVEPKVVRSDVFCRLLMCDSRDIVVVGEFLRKIRWVLAPPPSPP